MYRFLLFAVVILWSACPGFGSQGAEVIDEVPTFDKEIKPIFDRLCNECHGEVPEQGGEFFDIRYDVCEDTVIDGTTKLGAKAVSDRTQARFVDGGGMPPANYSESPTPDDIALVKRWIEEGSPCDASEVTNNGTSNNGTSNNGTSSNNGTTSANNGTTGGNNGTTAANNGTTAGPTFAEIATIIRDGCTDDGSVCHQNDAGGFQVTKTDTDAMVAAELQSPNPQGSPYVVANDAATSRLYIRMSDPTIPMPPAGLLNPSVIDTVEAWINSGANY